MSVSTTYNFNNAANFNLTNIQIPASLAFLSFQSDPAETFLQNFASDTGFTYNASEAEFASGVLRNKSSVSNALLAAPLSTNANPITTEADALWRTDGLSNSATFTASPPIISGGVLVCSGNQGAYWEGLTKPQLSAKFKYTPNYTTGPASNVNIVGQYNGTNNNNRWFLSHSPSGNTIRITISTSTSGIVLSTSAFGPAWNPVAGTEYEFEFCADSVSGDIYLFIDGALHAATSLTPWTWATDAAIRVYAGALHSYNNADGSFRDLITYDNVQHTSSYTAGYTIPTTIYSETAPIFPSFSYVNAGEIQSLTSISCTEVGAPHYAIDGQYWDGAAWAVSDGSYAQSNTLADLNTNLSTLVLTSNTVIPVFTVFPSGVTVTSIDDFQITYEGQKYPSDGQVVPTQCIEAASMSGYSHISSEPASTAIGVIINSDGVDMYWNGAAWVVSDGTYAQSNTAAVVNTNIAALSLGSNTTICLKWVFNTSDDQATPTLTSATITYEFGGVLPSTSTCIVYGYLKDITDTAIENAVVQFDLDTTSDSSYQEASGRVMSTTAKTTTTDVNGYFSMTLIRTSQYSEGGTYYIEITLPDGNIIGGTVATKLSFDVPDSTNKDITDLLPA